jgi:hypothetical protein
MTARAPWRRNAVGGLVAAVALAVITATQLWPSWSRYEATVVPAHVGPAGGSVDVGGHAWRLGATTHPAPTDGAHGRRQPAGTVRRVMTVERSGGPDALPCAGVVTDGHRRWNAERVSGFAVTLADGASDNCLRPGPLQWTFLLPGDVLPTALDVTDLNGRIIVRLLL